MNASLGGGGYSQLMKDAIDAAAGTTLFVVAAGNDGEDNDDLPTYPCNYTSVNLICVAATSENDALADFSNFGAESVDLAAPGTDILSVWPAYTALATETFETDLAGRWVAGGTPDTWARTASAHAGGAFSATDSPGGEYTENADNWLAKVGPTSFAGRTGCQAAYNLRLDTEAGFDFLVIESSTDNSSWTPQGGWSGSTEGEFFPLETDLSAENGQPTVYVRFRLQSDETINDDGAYVDDVALRCISTTYGADDYNSIQGTSMATPHVAGVAALVFAQHPTASVGQVRAAVLGAVDPVGGLSGVVATGGRLNACRALVGCVPSFRSRRLRRRSTPLRRRSARLRRLYHLLRRPRRRLSRVPR